MSPQSVSLTKWMRMRSAQKPSEDKLRGLLLSEASVCSYKPTF